MSGRLFPRGPTVPYPIPLIKKRASKRIISGLDSTKRIRGALLAAKSGSSATFVDAPDDSDDLVTDADDVKDDVTHTRPVGTRAAPTSDDDADSVDSDSSGTISEDLDLNKPNDSDEDEVDDSSEDEDDDADAAAKTITVDFDFKDPAPIDFLSVRNLLSRYLPTVESTKNGADGAGKAAAAEKSEEGTGADGSADDASSSSEAEEEDASSDDGGKKRSTTGKAGGKRQKKTITDCISAFNPSEIADAMIAQVEIGTTVKAGDDPDVYAFVTALGFVEHKGLAAMKAIQDYIMKKCPKRKRSQLRNVLGNKYTALLLNERMVNMPAEIAPNLHKCFVEDLDWALEQSSSADKFDIKQFVVMMPRFQPRVPKKKPVMDAAQAMGRKVSVREPPAARESEDEESEESEEEEEPEPDIPIAGDEKGPADVSDNAQHFYKWEEALLLERCNLNFTFAVNSAAQIEGAVPQFRTVGIISAKNYREAVLLMQDKLLEAMQAEADAKAADSKP